MEKRRERRQELREWRRKEIKKMITRVLKIFHVLATLVGIIFLAGCKTYSSMTHETVRVDSIVSVDTVYMERTEVRFDTTYVYDSHSERYVIGKVDTLWNIRVDTLRVETINYIYKEKAVTKTDSAANTKVNHQQKATTDVKAVETVAEKKNPALVVYALLGMMITGVVGFFVGRINKGEKWLI